MLVLDSYLDDYGTDINQAWLNHYRSYERLGLRRRVYFRANS